MFTPPEFDAVKLNFPTLIWPAPLIAEPVAESAESVLTYGISRLCESPVSSEDETIKDSRPNPSR
jgi:hypothetical protein